MPRGLFSMLVVASLASCGKGRVDPEREARERYIDLVLADAGDDPRRTLLSSSHLEYDEGWYSVEYEKKMGRAWRWMESRAVLKLRSGKERSMVLRLAGNVPIRPAAKSQEMSVRVFGREIDTFAMTGDFDHVVVFPEQLLPAPGETFEVVLQSEASWVAPGDLRALAVQIREVRWDPR